MPFNLRNTPPRADRGSDTMAWSLTGDGEFSNSSAYESLLDRTLKSNSNIFKLIWNWKRPERIQMHLWKCALEAMLTNDVRWRRGLASDNRCPLCDHGEETMMHMLRDCIHYTNAWTTIACGNLSSQFFDQDIRTWMIADLSDVGVRGGWQWNIIFGVALNCFWLARNEKVFHGQQPDARSLVMRIRNQVEVIHVSLNLQQLFPNVPLHYLWPR